MKRIAFITALLAALVAAMPASGAVLLAKKCTTSCSNFQANGTGWLSVVGNGAEWGSLQSGTVWVRDRTGKQNPRKYQGGWVHGTGLVWKSIGDDGWKVTSKHPMTVSASTKFWIKLQGPGIKVCGVFDGSGKVAGSGKYQIGSKSWQSWSAQTTDLHF